MTFIELLTDAARRAGEAIAGRRAPEFQCGDCPIMDRCGEEPRETCLARLEALERGDRRRSVGWDPTGITTVRQE